MSIFRLIKEIRSGLVLSVPLKAEQELSIEATGALLLNAEGPILTRAFSGLDYRIMSLSGQSNIPLERIRVPLTTSGLARSRLSLRTFNIEQPGRYHLSVTGLDHSPVDNRNQLVITQNRQGRTICTILVLVFSILGLAGGLVLSSIIFLENS